MAGNPETYMPKEGERVIVHEITWNGIVAAHPMIWHSVEPAPPDPEDKPQQ